MRETLEQVEAHPYDWPKPRTRNVRHIWDNAHYPPFVKTERNSKQEREKRTKFVKKIRS